MKCAILALALAGALMMAGCGSKLSKLIDDGKKVAKIGKTIKKIIDLREGRRAADIAALVPVVGQGIDGTPAVRVPLTDFGTSHLEMSDPYWVPIDGVVADSIATDEQEFSSRRDHIVCPGVPPNGTTCTSASATIDGQRYDFKDGALDYSIDWHAAYADHMQVSYPGNIQNYDLINGTLDEALDGGDRPKIRGGVGDYSAFYTAFYNLSTTTGTARATFSAAFGDLYTGRPTMEQGTATWRGAMTAIQRDSGSAVNGGSTLIYDFGDNTLDLSLNVREASNDGTYTGPDVFAWPNLQQNNDGSFYIPGYDNDRDGTGLHPTLGYVDGDFYGPNAEEFAGVFERSGVVGGFGGKRTDEP